MIMRRQWRTGSVPVFSQAGWALSAFSAEKIAQAVLKAGECSARQNGEEIDDSVATTLQTRWWLAGTIRCASTTRFQTGGQRIPALEDVQDMVRSSCQSTIYQRRLQRSSVIGRCASGHGSDPVRDPSAQQRQERLDGSDASAGAVDDPGDILPQGRARISTKLIEVLRMDEEAAVSVQGGGESNYRQQ